MTAAIDATLGGSASNSYVTLAEANTFAESQPWETQWGTYTDDQKTIALFQGVRWLESLLWVGTRCDPSTDDADIPQALAWPRHDAICDGVKASCGSIPPQIKTAQIELAFQFLLNPSAVIPIVPTPGPAEGVYVKRQKLDVLEIEYEEYAEHSSCNECSDPLIFRDFPWLRPLLGCWYAGVGASRQIKLVRN